MNHFRKVLKTFLISITILGPACTAFQLTILPAKCHLISRAGLKESKTDDLILGQNITTLKRAFIQPPTIRKQSICKYCSQSFASRNALFKHVRSDVTCSSMAVSEADAVGDSEAVYKSMYSRAPRRVVALLIGYYISVPRNVEVKEALSNHALVSARMKDAFIKVIMNLVKGMPATMKGNQTMQDVMYEHISQDLVITQASDTRFRHRALATEPTCNSVGDVLTFAFRCEKQVNIDMIVTGMNHELRSMTEYNEEMTVISAEYLSPSSTLHAERDATQYAYHYMIPVKWLPDGDKIAIWWLSLSNRAGKDTADGSIQKNLRFGVDQGKHRDRNEMSKPMAFKVLKNALQCAATISDEQSKAVNENEFYEKASGRFGGLSSKYKRCWHNFAAPSLQGDASPNNSPVWRSMDRVKTIEIIDFMDLNADVTYNGNHDNQTNDVFVVVELRGDGFLPQQVRRVIATVVGIANGWLPERYFSVATRPDTIIETPLAPDGLLYFAGTRYDFNEINLGRPLFGDENKMGLGQKKWKKDILNYVYNDRSVENEAVWLDELENIVSPRIRSKLDNIDSNTHGRNRDNARVKGGHSTDLDIPAHYRPTLSLLREIVSKGKWPGTSTARSKVIRSVDLSNTSSYGRNSGSFTLVDPTFKTEYGLTLPFANELFPDLVREIFSLEQELIQGAEGISMRLPSSHCAVNRNARFTPHVDSGTGAGQSLSMIVGLGEYEGGSLFVEGDTHDIRYKPLQFDGWRQRHWTEEFNGERFSLVWFTPEVKKRRMKEDSNAAKIVASHAERILPEYPPLIFRERSTDALVILELLDLDKGSAYQWSGIDPQWNVTDLDPISFSPEGHKVLDIGAHIGVYVRYALGAGATHVIAYEPEPSNIELLEKNTLQYNKYKNDSSSSVIICKSAVAIGEEGPREFILGKESGNKINTWRHSLDGYSHYKDKSLPRVVVNTVPFFGGALEPGITFVKIDCEGAEVDILLSEQASRPESWLDVSHLVLEWSFTKQISIKIFHQAIHNLNKSGFLVTFEGNGSWWNQNKSGDEQWPYHTDLVVFAARPNVIGRIIDDVPQ